MNFARVEAIARTVLYEGYNLYPYRPSAVKNQVRWTFGSVFPRDWAAREANDRSIMQTECLLRGGAEACVDVRVRFLHIVTREVGELPEPLSQMPIDGNPAYRPVPSLEADGAMLIAWEEAKEREVTVGPLAVAQLTGGPVIIPFAFAGQRTIEPVAGPDRRIVAVLVRRAQAVNGEVQVTAERIGDDVHRLTVRIENLTPLADAGASERAAAQRFAFASTHTLLGVNDGTFVSLLDPPSELAEAAAHCLNQGTWPVLVGDQGEAGMLLSSPIILYDYPKIAPESPGDLFDGTEIDEILTLRILTLTDAEKREIAAADPRSRAMLERTEALTAEELARLHGAFREPRSGGPEREAAPFKIGDRVRLKPKAGGDVMDVVLRDQIAVVEAVERDFENRIHVAVTIADDPGREFGVARMPGHRFFFAADEIEPLMPESAR